jgi:hypothetical protein
MEVSSQLHAPAALPPVHTHVPKQVPQQHIVQQTYYSHKFVADLIYFVTQHRNVLYPMRKDRKLF